MCCCVCHVWSSPPVRRGRLFVRAIFVRFFILICLGAFRFSLGKTVLRVMSLVLSSSL